MIEHAWQSAAAAGPSERVNLVVGTSPTCPTPEHTFNLIVSSMSQHHWSDPPADLRELRRTRRRLGGRICDLRLASRRAGAAARTALPDHVVRRETVRTGRAPISMFGRFVVEHPLTRPRAQGSGAQPDR